MKNSPTSEPIPIWHARFHEVTTNLLLVFCLGIYENVSAWLAYLHGLLSWLESYEHLPKHEVQSQSIMAT